MKISGRLESPTAEQISAIRLFNRFYTAKLGLLRRRHLDSTFALTEARMLYEIGAQPTMTAAALQDVLELDAGYISRLLSTLVRRKLVRRVASKIDAREKLLSLTPLGEKAVARIDEQSIAQIHGMLTTMDDGDRAALVESLAKVRSILSRPPKPPVYIVRLATANDDALAMLHEYYQAVRVVQRDKPGSIQKLIDTPASGMWLAYLEKEVVGCVVLRKLPSISHAAECKRLYVRPSARGKRIADMLLDAQEAFARSQGLEWIYLDSYDDLKASIALYEKRGYQRCARYNDNPQATLFMRKRLA